MMRYDKKSATEQAAFKTLFECLESVVETLPDGRAKSHVLTHLEEAYMWVGKAIRDDQIARTGKVDEQPERNNE